VSESQSQRLRVLLDQSVASSRFPWWEWNIGTNRVIASPLKVTMLGYRVQDYAGAGYERFMELVHSEDASRTLQAMRNHLEGRAPLYEIDYRIRTASGSYTWYMDRGVIVRRDPQGRPAVLRGIVLDLGPDLRARALDAAVVEAIRSALPAGEGSVRQLCRSCLRMKYGNQEWITVPASLQNGFPAQVSHGLCAECIRILYPEFADSVLSGEEGSG
jgi:PAS domain S-box-containing protein